MARFYLYFCALQLSHDDDDDVGDHRINSVNVLVPYFGTSASHFDDCKVPLQRFCRDSADFYTARQGPFATPQKRAPKEA